MSETPSDVKLLTYRVLQNATREEVAAIRAVTKLVPAGGPGDKVFPPTYQGGKYASEKRRVGNVEVETVLLDSVQSQANRMELALRAAYERGELKFPLLTVDFGGKFPQIGKISALDAPHRIADAIFRDSLLGGKPFRNSPEGVAFTQARVSNATSLFELCPTALIFGVWDSTGPRGGMGAKFPRSLVSEIVGFDAVAGVRTASRIDPLQISAQAGPIYEAKNGSWTLQEDEAKRDPKTKQPKRIGKDGKPSEINLGNVTPDLVYDDRGNVLPGGVTISHALQTTVLSLPALRRLRFPVRGGSDGDLSKAETANIAARTVLAALGLAAIEYQRQEGYDLRSRCLLVPVEAAVFELVPADGGKPTRFCVTVPLVQQIFREAIQAAREAGLPWREGEITLRPSPNLIELVRRSEQLAATSSVS